MSYTNTKLDLAIIIPTLNEEHFIGRLLDSIIRQTIWPKEIVVVDAMSKDKTISEIKKRQAKIANLKYFKIPKYTIARQRNFGVKKTKSPHLLFLDADMELRGEETLDKYSKEFLRKKPDVAAAPTLPDIKNWKNSVYFKAEDLAFKFSQYFWPVVTARNLYIKRAMFDLVDGFDEEIKVGEDQELVQRIVNAGGKLIFLKTVKLYTSVRRVEYEGRRKYALRMILFALNILLRGPKNSKVKYDFGHFNKQV
ncbi:glycosyltransferase [Candidatus Daviesbacteria bacterium]|nr:glycosyltransferase [Candidatus Daviesbacteria bacterium]